MKVLISAESFLPRSNGVTNTVLRSMCHLRERGHEVLVIAPGDGPVSLDGQRIVRIPSISLRSKVTVDLAIPSKGTVERVFDSFSPDVVHLASPYFLGDQVGKVSKARNVPTIAVYQTDVAGFATFYGLSSIRNLAEKKLRKIHSRADLNLAPSTSSISYLHSLGVSRVRHWGRGVDHEIFNPQRRSKEIRASWFSDKRTFAVGFVGRLAPEKQVENLRTLGSLISTSLRPIQLVIIGDGPSRSKLQELLPHAYFTGLLSGVELGRAMASLDLLVTTGENETFCQVIQEGMASSLPVIAPKVGGPVDLISASETGLFYQPGDLNDLSRSVAELASNPERARQMGINGARSVADRSWSKIGDQLLGYYNEAIDAHAEANSA